jgi:L-fucose isomerase-like protein
MKGETMSGQYKQKGAKLKLGFMPTRRNVFSKEEAGKQKKLIEKDLAKYDVELVTLDFLNDEGLLFSVHDANRVADEFLAKKVDAIFAAHCNFGTEDAVAKAAKLAGVPVLLWGPRDETPDENGLRSKDTQCGLFATSKALLRYGVPFTYLTNSWIGSESFDNGFRRFLTTASAAKAMRKMRIGQIGPRPAPFLTVMYNEGELLERFGI